MKHAWIWEIDHLSRATGLQPETFYDLLAPVWVTSHERRSEVQNLAADDQLGPAVRFLILHSVESSDIADTTGINLPAITRFRHGHSHAPSEKAQEVVALAKQGRSGTEILRIIDNTGKGWLYRTLEQARVNAKPFGKRGVTNNEQRAAVVDGYRRGDTYSEIASSTGVSVPNVKNILRRAHETGRLPEYGHRQRKATTTP